jgi:hypothetical protein
MKSVFSGNFENLIQQFRQCLEKARAINLQGDLPFITAQYISTVIDNLESSNDALFKEYHSNRQKAIIRNLTDTSFLGKYLLSGKIIMQGGAWHMGDNVASDSINNRWEGPYLTHIFEATRNKTYSIDINAIARSLGEACAVDSLYYEPGLGYRGLLEKMQDAYKKGVITSDDCYFVSIYDSSLDDYSKLWLEKGREYNYQGLLIDTTSINKMIDEVISKESKKTDLFKSIKNDIRSFDNLIIIPYSPLITPIPKKYSDIKF